MPVLLDRMHAAHGIRTRVITDAMTGAVRVATEQDVTPILEANRRMRNSYDAARARKVEGGWRPDASLPMTVVMQLNQRGIMRGLAIVDEPAFVRFINDPDHRYLRTSPLVRPGYG